MPAEFEVDPDITTAHLHELEERGLIPDDTRLLRSRDCSCRGRIAHKSWVSSTKTDGKGRTAVLIDKTLGPILIRLFDWSIGIETQIWRNLQPK